MNANLTTCLALALALVLPPAVAAGDPQADLRALEGRLLQALVDGDAEVVGQLISPGFGYYQAALDRPMQGLDAEQWQRAALGSHRLESFEIHESHARLIGDQVVQTATRATLDRAGRAAGRQRLLTSTWLQDQDGAWKVVTRLDVELGSAGGAGGGQDRQAARERWGSEQDREALRQTMREQWGEGQDREALIEALRERMGDRWPERPAGESAEEEPPPNDG